MSEHDYTLINQTGANLRADLNSVLSAIVSQNSKATEPTTMFAYMFWADTTTGILKQRNATNTAWITIGTLAIANLGLALVGGLSTQVFSAATATAAENVVRLDQTNISGPTFFAYLPTTSQSITSGVATKVTLSSELFDTASAFDTATNYRFTPLVAGYYQINFAAYLSATGTTITDASAEIRKNGALYCRGDIYVGPAISSFASTASAVVFMNGTTDYLELFATVAGTSPIVFFGSTYTNFSGSLTRRS
jgi:hypothetical protein